MTWLERAYEGKEAQLTIRLREPAFDGLHADRRFKTLLRCLNLPEK